MCGSNFIQKKLIINNIQSPVVCNQVEEKESQITIWIHGTKFFFNYFFPTLFYCPLGITPVLNLEKKYHHRSIAQILCQKDPVRFNLSTFYLFGWSGKLSFQAREMAAEQLYQALKLLVAEYNNKYGKKPFIRIIAHSHAGNVVLNMVKIKDADSTIKISELILLACPVQEKTASLVTDPFFEKIYSIFSTSDSVQILDPQGLYRIKKDETKPPFFSQRLFAAQPHIVQVALKLNGQSPMHMGFLFGKFLNILPPVLDELDVWIKEQSSLDLKKPLLLNVVDKEKEI